MLGMGVGAREGELDGTRVGWLLGIDVGAREGKFDGAAVGWIVGAPVGSSVGSADGSAVGVKVGLLVGESVGTEVGTKDGTGVGGLVYSTTSVVVVTEEPWVAFLLAVMFTSVIFTLAVARAVERLPLDAADEICEENELVRLAELPSYSYVSRRRSSSLVRATTPSRRTLSVKRTSTAVTTPDASVIFSARTIVTWAVS